MKRLISLLLAIVMLATLFCACDKDKETETEAKAPEQSGEVSRGETSSASYENASLGIHFNLPEGWRFYTDEELAAMMNMTLDQFKNPELFDSEKMASVIEFMAINDATSANINLSIENSRGMTIDQYISAFKNTLAQQLQGATYTFSDKVSVKLGNTDFWRIDATCVYYGVEMTQYIYINKIDSYMVVVSATTLSSNSSAEFEAMFS